MIKRAILPFLLFCSTLFAVGSYRETGPRHVSSAWNLNKGGLFVTTQGRFYTKQDIFTGPGGLESGVTIWDSQLSASLAYGLSQYMEVGIVPILRQKNHKTGTSADVPGDIYVYSKLGSIGRLDSPYKMALQFDTRIPTAAHHNIPLQSYSTNSIGYGATGMFSINANPKHPTSGWAFDFNLGYFNHNDQDLELDESESDTISVASSTQEILAGVSARLMGQSFGLFSEMHARMFLQEPPVVAYTRENSVYFTQGFLYQFNPYIRVVTSVDFLLGGKTDETTYFDGETKLVEKHWETLPNFPEWRANVGFEFRLSRGKTPVAKPKTEKVESKEVEEKEPEERNVQDLQRRFQEQQIRPEESQEEYEARLQRERQRMEELLQNLRERLKQEAIEQKKEQERKKLEQERLEQEQKAKEQKSGGIQEREESTEQPGAQLEEIEQPGQQTQEPESADQEIVDTENASQEPTAAEPSEQETATTQDKQEPAGTEGTASGVDEAEQSDQELNAEESESEPSKQNPDETEQPES